MVVEFSPSGGLFQYAFQLGEALAAAGHTVQLITGPNPELEASQPGFTIRPVLPTWHPAAGPAISNRLLRLPLRAFRAGQLIVAWIVLGFVLAATRPRAVLWQHWRFTFEPAFVALFAKILHRKVFGASMLGMVAHEPLPRSDSRDTSTPKSGKMLEAAFGSAWRSLDAAFVLGPKTRDIVIEHWRPSCPVVEIPHGSEGALAAPHAALPPVSETDPVALFFGTWTTYKGLHVLLDAFELVRREMPEAKLEIVGNPGADIDAAAVIARAESIGNIYSQPGYLAVSDVPAVLGRTRVVVTPYIRASQSGVNHLAFTFGRPVVTSDAGDLAASVADGITGLVVPAGQIEPLATAMLKLLRSPSLAESLGAAGRDEIERAWPEAASRILATLDQVEASR